MADIDINFKDRIVEFPYRYTMTDNGDGTYTLIPFPGEVSEVGTPINAANMNEIVDKHNALYDEVVPRLFSIAKRRMDGKIIYMLENSDDPSQNRPWGNLSGIWSKSETFRPLTIQPSTKKRFLKVSVRAIVYYTGSSGSGVITSSLDLKNADTGDILYTKGYIHSLTSDPETSTTEITYITSSIEIEAGQTFTLEVVINASASSTITSFSGVGALIKEFRVYMEDVEFQL